MRNISIILFSLSVAFTTALIAPRYFSMSVNGTTNTSSSSPIKCEQKFKDVSSNDSFIPYISCVACNKVMNGYSDNTFHPSSTVTRGQVAVSLSRAMQLSNPTSTHQLFADIPVNSTFYDATTEVTNKKLMSSYACGGPGEPCDTLKRPYFRPNETVIRSHLAKFVANAKFPAPLPSNKQTFTDVPPSNIFYSYIERLASRSIISGYECGGKGEPCDTLKRPYFRPNNNATREQAAKIFAGSFFPSCSKGM